jgi:hypothetical protein
VAHTPRKRLGDLLLESGIVDSTQVQAAVGHQRRWGGRIGQSLIDLKMATEEQVVAALALKLGFERAALDLVEYGPGLELALRLVPHEFAERNQLLPYAADAVNLFVAMADPSNVGVVDELAFRTGRRVKVAIAGDREIARAIRRLYLADKGVEAIAFDEGDEGPVEMMGSLDRGYTQGLDDYFQKGAPAPGAPPVVPVARVAPVSVPAPPILVPTTSAGSPPPLPTQPVPVSTSGPEARLAEAVRRLKLNDAAPAPGAPGPELIVEMIPEGEGEFGPRIEAMLDGLDRIALHEGCPAEVVRLSRLASAMMRLMLRKKLVTEDEMVAEFVRTEGVGPNRAS